MRNYFFTSESVSEGHPDKISDLISDTVVDLMISKDPYSRVACETLVTTNKVVIAGEYRLEANKSNLFQEIEEKIRLAIKKIGYEQPGFHWEKIQIENYLHNQSSDIALGVDQNKNKEEGAGDQGLMFGYAVDETETYMPAPIYYSHLILKELSNIRHSGRAGFLGPDSKSQLSVEYDGFKPIGAKKIVVSTQHEENYNQENLKEFIVEVIKKVLPKEWSYNSDDILVNPTGRFVIGGPDGDTGLTGRKIIVDTYGGSAQHGGGAFSGKDPTKVDRSAAYMTRYLAKNVVASNLASKCSIQIAYAIGVSEPLSLYVNTFGTGKVDDQIIEECIKKNIDLSPKGIRNKLKLNNPIYVPTSAYGHFGRHPDESIKGSFTWEKTDLVEMLKKEL
jgi:S-adenosylmethionine synthetase